MPPSRVGAREEQLYDDYAQSWLREKVEGLIGDRPLSPNSERDYRWRLAYSRAFFARKRVEEIDHDDALAFKADLIATSRQNRDAIAAGADLRDHRGRRLVPLSPASIKKIIQAFAAVLDEAVEDRLRPDNPARSRRMRIRVPKPKRHFLEMDELAALFTAAHDQDVTVPDLRGLDLERGSTAEKVARLAATGIRPSQIADQLTISKGTVTYHLHRLGIKPGRGYVGRRVICEILGRSGLRVSELCDLKIGDVRLHDPDGTRFRIVDAKTEAGERVVEATPELTQILIEHLDRLRRAGLPTGPSAYLTPNSPGRQDQPAEGSCHRRRGCRARERSSRRAGLAATPQNDSPRTETHLYLDRIGRQQLSPGVGHEPSRARGFEDDYGRLRATAAAGKAPARRALRPADTRGR